MKYVKLKDWYFACLCYDFIPATMLILVSVCCACTPVFILIRLDSQLLKDQIILSVSPL